jgi:hypothetical protein
MTTLVPAYTPRIVQRGLIGRVVKAIRYEGGDYNLIRIRCSCCPGRRPWFGHDPSRKLRVGDMVVFDADRAYFKNMDCADRVRKVTV